MSDALKRRIGSALAHREKHGRHLHHRDCIHNLPPEQQVTIRGKTVEWWTVMVGPLPNQITPEQWECEPPLAGHTGGHRMSGEWNEHDDMARYCALCREGIKHSGGHR